MNKELYMKDKGNKIVIKSDDLVYDGKNIIIPSYYTETLIDYISEFNTKNAAPADVEDYIAFKNFLLSVQKRKTK